MSGLTTTQAQQITAAFMAVITVTIAAFDVTIIRLYGREASISHAMTWCFSRYPTLAYAFVFWLGVWAGHVFLPHGTIE